MTDEERLKLAQEMSNPVLSKVHHVREYLEVAAFAVALSAKLAEVQAERDGLRDQLPLCRCLPETCLLHPSLSTCGMRDRASPREVVPIDIIDGLHHLLTVRGIASRSREYEGLVTDLIAFMAKAERQSRAHREVVPACCPQCGNQTEIASQPNDDWPWTCLACDADFEAPTYWQRVKGPA